MRVLARFGLLVLGVAAAAACGGESSRGVDERTASAGASPQVSPPSVGGGDSSAGADSASRGGTETGSGGSADSGTASGGNALGGVSGGGSGAAGAPVAGSPGAGGSRPVPMPGCAPVGKSSGPNECALELDCFSGAVGVTCSSVDPDGVWSCECQGAIPKRGLELGGFQGESACLVAGALCLRGTVEGAPGECAPELVERESQSCRIEHRCPTTYSLPDGTSAIGTQTAYARCSSTGANMECACHNGRRYVLEDADGATACDTLIEVCEDPEVMLEGEIAVGCEPQSASSDGVSCSVELVCSFDRGIRDNVFYRTEGSRTLACEEQPGEPARCLCASDTWQVSFDADDEEAISSTCAVLEGACSGIDEIELNPSVSCAPSFQSTSVGECRLDLECTQTATLGDRELRASTWLGISCVETGPSWSCSCDTASDSGQIEIEEIGPDPCSAAVDRCRDAVDVGLRKLDGGILPY